MHSGETAYLKIYSKHCHNSVYGSENDFLVPESDSMFVVRKVHLASICATAQVEDFAETELNTTNIYIIACYRKSVQMVVFISSRAEPG